MAIIPEALNVVHVAPVRIALALPIEPASRDPIAPRRAQVLGAPRHRISHLAGAHHLVHLVRIVAPVIPKGHEDIARIAPDANVFRLRVVRQPVEAEVALDAAAFLDAIEQPHHHVQRAHAGVHPGRHVVEARHFLGVEVDEIDDDHLRPSRTALVRRRDNDVVVARLERLPTCGVEVMILIDAGDLGHALCHDTLLRLGTSKAGRIPKQRQKWGRIGPRKTPFSRDVSTGLSDRVRGDPPPARREGNPRHRKTSPGMQRHTDGSHRARSARRCCGRIR